MLRIYANPGNVEQAVFDVPLGTLTIGRTKDNDVYVLHKSMSREHARLENDGVRLVLTDLDSKNGTFVGRDRITTRTISTGDRFRCGNVIFELRHADAPTSRVPAPSLVSDSRRNLSNVIIEDLLGSKPAPSTRGSLRLAAADSATRARDRLDVLLKVAQLLGKPSEIDDLLGAVVDLVLRIMDVDRAAVLLVDESTGRLAPRITRAAHGAAPERFFSAHIVEWVRANRTAALFGDAVADAPADAIASIVAQSICSSMCAARQVSDRLLGILYVDNLRRPTASSRKTSTSSAPSPVRWPSPSRTLLCGDGSSERPRCAARSPASFRPPPSSGSPRREAPRSVLSRPRSPRCLPTSAASRRCPSR
jgi:adenylate cyclase